MPLIDRLERALDQGVDPEVFERAASALLEDKYPWFSPVEAGKDFGRDADIYGVVSGDPDSRGRLLATTCGDPCPVAQDIAQTQGVNFKAYTVGFNAPDQAEGELQCIARVTGGAYIPASNTASLASWRRAEDGAPAPPAGRQASEAERRSKWRAPAIPHHADLGDAPNKIRALTASMPLTSSVRRRGDLSGWVVRGCASPGRAQWMVSRLVSTGS
jgi:hypothetical protein